MQAEALDALDEASSMVVVRGGTCLFVAHGRELQSLTTRVHKRPVDLQQRQSVPPAISQKLATHSLLIRARQFTLHDLRECA